jgi:hypothetical protein
LKNKNKTKQHNFKCDSKPFLSSFFLPSSFPSKNDNLNSAQGIITTLKSWTGIIYLSASKRTSIQSLVDSLLLPFEDTRKQMLDILFEVFRLKAPMWSVDFLSALRRTVDYHLIDGGVHEYVPLLDLFFFFSF